MNASADRTQINELLHRHQIHIDLADAEGYAALFAPDGHYESPFAFATGRADIVEMFRSLGASGFTKDKRHFSGPAMVDIAGERAAALSYWWVADYAGPKPQVFATGTYKDQLRRIDGEWKIEHRVQTLDSTDG